MLALNGGMKYQSVQSAKSRKCAIPTCPNFLDLEGTYKFHEFPSDAATRSAWEAVCGRSNLESTICGDHFTEDDYTGASLKSTAVPSINVGSTGQEEHERLLKSLEALKDDLSAKLQRLKSRRQARKARLARSIEKCRQLKMRPVNGNKLLSRVFSEAQINVLRGGRRSAWKDDDMARAFSLRHLGGRACYLYMKYSLNYPLPALSGMVGCSVYGCGSVAGLSPNVAFYEFPKDAAVAQLWYDSCLWKGHIDIERDRVCSLHFEEHSFKSEYTLYVKALNDDAVPALNLLRSAELKHEATSEQIKLENAGLKKAVAECERSIRDLEAEIAQYTTVCKDVASRQRETDELLLKLRAERLSDAEQVRLLGKVFSESQIKILTGKKKIYWSNDDMAVAHTLRHLSNRRCYAYLTKNLNVPLPALSSIKRWTAMKRGGRTSVKTEDSE